MTQTKTSWTFFDIWNTSIEQGRPERALLPRDYIYASELGQSYIDRFLKMTGVSMTNPPNARAKRKFEAGNVWEWIVELILIRAGILTESQKECEYRYEGIDDETKSLLVRGRIDFIAGGTPDWDRAEAEIKELHLPETIALGALRIVSELQKKYPNGLDPIILEVKSKGSILFDRIERTGQPEPHHALQLYHYLKATGMKEGHIVYICREDCRMIEIGVYNPSDLWKPYIYDIQTLTRYIRKGERPPKEKEILFDSETFKFTKNWKVEYSPYLTYLYGYNEPIDYYQKTTRIVGQWNRVFKRCVDKAKMTPLNLDVIKEIKKSFSNFEDLVWDAQKKGVRLTDEMGESEKE